MLTALNMTRRDNLKEAEYQAASQRKRYYNQIWCDEMHAINSASVTLDCIYCAASHPCLVHKFCSTGTTLNVPNLWAPVKHLFVCFFAFKGSPTAKTPRSFSSPHYVHFCMDTWHYTVALAVRSHLWKDLHMKLKSKYFWLVKKNLNVKKIK